MDIGNYGSNADGSIFKHSNFGQTFINGQLNIQDPKLLPNYPEGGVLPYCIVADEAFPLRMDLMRPFPRGGRMQMPDDKRIFNYRLSRACHIVENAFGILAQRWRVFQRRLCLQASNVDKVVKACVVLHNYLQDTIDLPALYNRLNPDHEPYLQDDGAILAVPNLHGYHSSEQARAIRNIYKTYFTRPEGDVYWQNRAIHQ